MRSIYCEYTRLSDVYTCMYIRCIYGVSLRHIYTMYIHAVCTRHIHGVYTTCVCGVDIYGVYIRLIYTPYRAEYIWIYVYIRLMFTQYIYAECMTIFTYIRIEFWHVHGPYKPSSGWSQSGFEYLAGLGQAGQLSPKLTCKIYNN